jgi:hypothetical protein
MLMRRSLFALVVALLVAGCTDQSVLPTSPDVSADMMAVSADMMAVGDDAGSTLRQSPTAPALETYEVSFWVRRDRGGSVAVDYLPKAGRRYGARFLKFEVPDRSVASWPGQNPRAKRDSVKITLTIDPVLLSVHFEPSGLRFKSGKGAKLTIWYGNADPDLNQDGKVDAADWELEAQISIWYDKKHKGKRVGSDNDWISQTVTARLPHFSQYAVSW